MDDSLKKPLILIEGKGGVGKTSVATALGLVLAREGKRVLVLELSAEGHVPPVFGEEASSEAPVDLGNGLFAQTLVPDRCLEEYALIKLHFRALYKLIFKNPIIRALMRMVPAMDELLVIGKIEHLVRSGDWDHVIVDAPVTGEGILLFMLPRVITEAVRRGPLHDDAARIRGLLEDPARTVMHIVTLAEEMPAEETEQLHEAMVEQVGLPLGRLIVDRLYPPTLGERERELLSGATSERRDDCLQDLREVLGFMARRREQQDRYLARLSARVPMAQRLLPEVFSALDEREVVEALAQCLGSPPP
jgi:anion-transporting  ArsA/GET3 family ATPase